jgi:hypothetical protein
MLQGFGRNKINEHQRTSKNINQGYIMTITTGQTLPAGTLTEFVEVEGNGCSIGPNAFSSDGFD